MKLRHARAIAVCAVVLVALTGARRSGGGGCDDNDNDHSSSSSSGGGITSGGLSTGGNGSTGSTPGATPTGGSRNDDATQEIKIVKCTVAPSETMGLIVDYTVTNSASYDATYHVSFDFTDTYGGELGFAMDNSDVIPAGQTRSQKAYGSLKGEASGGGDGDCDIDIANKFHGDR
ncbi:hypothetical protein [Streptomyces sp. NPDC048636]|uniref:hypothetical protein n=1 Tax=Streptomyces sp. NPDC048636 TaxID=3155762 RepID=UPI003444FB29